MVHVRPTTNNSPRPVVCPTAASDTADSKTNDVSAKALDKVSE